MINQIHYSVTQYGNYATGFVFCETSLQQTNGISEHLDCMMVSSEIVYSNFLTSFPFLELDLRFTKCLFGNNFVSLKRFNSILSNNIDNQLDATITVY